MTRSQHDDAYQTYEVGDGIYWVGFADWSTGFSNSPYLITSDDEAVLIDPGSVLHYHVVAKKVLQIVEPQQIAAIILLHQDPDLCASVPRFEALIERPIRVIAHRLTTRFLPYYGITSELVTPEDRETMLLAGREIEFHHTPYVHFAGAMMAWEPGTRTLFASDVFAALSKHWTLFAGDDYVEATRTFVEQYDGSETAWLAALDRVRSLDPERICPQHGSIIEGNVDEYLDAVAGFQVGRALRARATGEGA